MWVNGRVALHILVLTTLCACSAVFNCNDISWYRLGKKLIEPLTNLIHSTSAMSLLYECINTVIAVLISISSGRRYKKIVLLKVIRFEQSNCHTVFLHLLTSVVDPKPSESEVINCIHTRTSGIDHWFIQKFSSQNKKRHSVQLVRENLFLLKVV